MGRPAPGRRGGPARQTAGTTRPHRPAGAAGPVSPADSRRRATGAATASAQLGPGPVSLRLARCPPLVTSWDSDQDRVGRATDGDAADLAPVIGALPEGAVGVAPVCPNLACADVSEWTGI